MTLKLPRVGSKALRVVRFISIHDGLRYSEIVRFICEMNGLDYDLFLPAMRWDPRKGKVVSRPVRRYAGTWGTNLSSSSTGILKRFCVKGTDRKWRVTAETAALVDALFEIKAAPEITQNEPRIHDVLPSSLENDFPSDTISGNSKFAGREYISPYISFDNSGTMKLDSLGINEHINFDYTNSMDLTDQEPQYEHVETAAGAFLRRKPTKPTGEILIKQVERATAELLRARAELQEHEKVMQAARDKLHRLQRAETDAGEAVRNLLDL